jgi:hypothetical protein
MIAPPSYYSSKSSYHLPSLFDKDQETQRHQHSTGFLDKVMQILGNERELLRWSPRLLEVKALAKDDYGVGVACARKRAVSFAT